MYTLIGRKLYDQGKYRIPSNFFWIHKLGLKVQVPIVSAIYCRQDQTSMRNNEGIWPINWNDFYYQKSTINQVCQYRFENSLCLALFIPSWEMFPHSLIKMIGSISNIATPTEIAILSVIPGNLTNKWMNQMINW